MSKLVYTIMSRFPYRGASNGDTITYSRRNLVRMSTNHPVKPFADRRDHRALSTPSERLKSTHSCRSLPSIAMACPIPVIGRSRPDRPGGEKPNKDAVSGRRNGYALAVERRERRQRRQARRTSANGRGSDPGGGGFRSGPLAHPSSRTRLGN